MKAHIRFMILQSISAVIFLFYCVSCLADVDQNQDVVSNKEIVAANNKNNENKLLFSDSDISSEEIIDSKGGDATLEGIVSVYFRKMHCQVIQK